MSAPSRPPDTTPGAAAARPLHERFTARERRRNLGLLFSAHFVSGFAQGITLIAIPWYIVSRLGAPELNAAVLGSIQLVIAGWGLYGGTLVDKYNRKHLLMSINAAGALVLAGASLWGFLVGFPAAGAADVPGFWSLPATWISVALLGLIVLSTYMIFTIYYPNLYAFLQELFPPELYGRVNAGVEFLGQLTNAIGMAVGSILLDGTLGLDFWPAGWHLMAWPLEQMFLLNTGTYLAALAILSFIRYRMRPRGADAGMGVADRVRTGLNFLRQRPQLVAFGLSSYSIFFVTLTFFPVVLPSYIDNVLQETGSYMGLAESLFALGALGVGVMGIQYGRRLGGRLILPLVGGVLLLGAAALGILAALPSVAVLLGISALLGLLNSAARVLRLTYLLKAVPNAVIGRSNSILAITNSFARALFILVVFPLVLDFPPAEQARAAVWFQSGVVLLAALVFFRQYAQFDRPA